ncbi:MAG: hypothetical protein D6718_05425 [Acidobacteria bacterium]|nr:MAG: hypothetical protein D6718_05425 [Acidobacteriota bacterium]
MTALGTIRIGDADRSVLTARRKLQRVAGLLGLGEIAAARLAAAASEIGRCIGASEGGGRLEVALLADPPRLQLTAVPALPGTLARRVAAVLGAGGGVAPLRQGTLVTVRLPARPAAGTAALEAVIAEPTREELFAELQRRNEELERATRLKSQFLANVSHELRTPMNAIIGFTTRVLRKAGDVLPPKQLRNLHTVERNARQLLDLINSLLDLSKIEAGRMEVHAERFRLSDLLQEVSDLLAPLASDKGLRFEVCGGADAALETDRGKLKQVLTNLLGNAIKFTEDGSVTLEARLDAERGTACFVVEDTGPGIPEEALPVIFEPFRQVDGGDARRAGGTGLGLAIVREMVRLLGGEVSVASEVGRGTRFTVTVPLCAPGAVAQAAAPEPAGAGQE